MGRGLLASRRTTAITFALALLGNAALAADVVIEGCNELAPGQIGIRELVGDVGDTVGVAVTVASVGEIDSFSLDITFPRSLLSYVRTEPGELTSHFWLLGGWYPTVDDEVRLSGTELDVPIPGGTTGALGVVFFEVIAAGSGAFATGDYLDDVRSNLGYVPCESVHGTSPVAPRLWGRVKSLYR